MKERIPKELSDKIDNIIKEMTISEKCDSLSSSGNKIERLGIPETGLWGEAAHGVQARHDQSFDLGITEFTTVFPNPYGMASMFDTELMEEIGKVVGDEGRSLYNERRSRALTMWAPTIDMARDPRWGRNEEAYGEDPVLSASMAGAYIRGMKGDDPVYVKIGATLKHFFGNNVEEGRFTDNSVINDRLKHEYYMEVFRLCIKKSDPEAVMTAYNLINNVPGILNPDVGNILKKWGLSHVVCDANAMVQVAQYQKVFDEDSYTVATAIKSGVDVFSDDKEKVSDALRTALANGILTEEELDRCLKNKFTTYARNGIFSENVFPKKYYNITKVNTPLSREVSRKAAKEAVVLLKNDGTLPLNNEKSIALLGPFADRCPLDWYSGIPDHTVTLYEAILDEYTELGKSKVVKDELFPEVRIAFGDKYLGLSKESILIDKYSHVLFMKADPSLSRDSFEVIPVDKEDAEVFSIMLWDEKRLTIRSKSTGRLLSLKSPDDIVLTNPEKREKVYAISEEAYGWFAEEEFMLSDKFGRIISFNDENAASFWEDERISGLLGFDGDPVYSDIHFETVVSPEDKISMIKEKGVDVSLGVFGLHPIINCREERDRTTIELPPFQRAVYGMISDTFDKNVLVLAANAPLGVSAEDSSGKVNAIIYSAFGSEEFGNGLSSVLYGKYSPAGRLPSTWYRCDADIPDKNDYDIIGSPRTYMYFDKEVLYPFGYGLSYTDFKFSDMTVLSKEDSYKVSVNVTNAGDMVSDISIPLFFRQDKEGETRPIKRLCAFTRESGILPGETRNVTLYPEKDDMMFYNASQGKMQFETGRKIFYIEEISTEVEE